MAYSDHLLGYRSDSTEDLETERTALKAQRTVFVQQAMGTKNFQRDLRLLEERLQAVQFVLRERGALTIIPAVINHSIGITSFEDVE